jgi:hypothetical protein
MAQKAICTTPCYYCVVFAMDPNLTSDNLKYYVWVVREVKRLKIESYVAVLTNRFI